MQKLPSFPTSKTVFRLQLHYKLILVLYHIYCWGNHSDTEPPMHKKENSILHEGPVLTNHLTQVWQNEWPGPAQGLLVPQVAFDMLPTFPGDDQPLHVPLFGQEKQEGDRAEEAMRRRLGGKEPTTVFSFMLPLWLHRLLPTKEVGEEATETGSQLLGWGNNLCQPLG